MSRNESNSYEVGTQLSRDAAAIGEANRVRHGSACHCHGCGEFNTEFAAERESCLEQTRRDVVRGQRVQQTVSRQFSRRDVPRVRLAQDNVGRAHDGLEPELSSPPRRLDGRRKFRDCRAFTMTFFHVHSGGVVVRGKQERASGGDLSDGAT